MTDLHDADRRTSAALVGIDDVRAHPDRRTLTVTFSGPLPAHVGRDSFVIEGGRRVVGLKVLHVGRETGEEPDGRAAHRRTLTLDRPGDDSTYRLRVLGRGFHGGRNRAEFTFHPTARPEAAPGAEPVGAPPARPAPAVDYLAKDYASLRRLLLERLSLTLPRWTERHAPDLWITLVEILAHVGDQLSYQQDAVATEACLDTARLRTSVRRHARLVGYPMHDGCAARTVVCVETSAALTVHTRQLAFTALPSDETGGASDPVMTAGALAAGPHPVYQPLEPRETTFLPEHNRVALWAWGQDAYRLPAGTTRAALLDQHPGQGRGRVLRFRAGDLIVLEETAGPDGGAADPTHRQAVRITWTTPDIDDYTGTPVLKIAWAEEDALTFPLTVRNPRDADGRPGATVVACGNAVLVEHGLENTWLPDRTADILHVPDTAAEPPGIPRRPFTATLSGRPVTWSPPHPRPADAAAAQARRLLDLAAEARDRLRDLQHSATELDAEDRKFLRALFGRAYSDTEDPETHLLRLRSRFDELLEPKLRQVDRLVRRARAGYVLDPDDMRELGRTWAGLSGASLRPDDTALNGPASTALRPDPREALPALRLVEEESGHSTKPDWLPRRDLLSSGPRDRHVTAETDDDGVLSLRFGDGRCGRAPRPGGKLSAVYRVGNGRAGNTGSEAVNRVAARETDLRGVVTRETDLRGVVTRVRNPLPATGGTDPEPVDEVRRAAPSAPFRTLLRAVTAEDYATLAARRPGVQRATATLRWTGSWYEADVALDPEGATAPSPRLLEDVRTDLHRYRRIGHDVVTRPALLVPLDIAIDVLVDPHQVTAYVRTALLHRLLPGRRTGGRTGFFDPSALTFGTPVRADALVALCMDVPGVRHAEVTRLRRTHDDTGPGQDVPSSGELRLRPHEIPRLDGDVTRPENGRLALNLRGGR
ncbi:putative baseplate assembly protein [Streptomyces sp. NPDC001595]|uniref:putative baseplate assembly protein n=1 Tax=Streptomyces sp. NPDC001532 TaxID=3154520 RepID=UPI00331BB218